MKKSVVICLISLVGLSAPASATSVETYTAESRAVIKQFFGTLKGELVAAIKQGGPPNAITVCSNKAQTIALDLSLEKGWDIGRTSLKLRNPINAPDAWEKRVLMDFESRKAKGESPKGMDHAEIVAVGGKKAFRYMMAIPTAAKPCLACHGETVKPAVEAALKKKYPLDKARGYKAGDIRGAFTISFPVN